MPPQNYETFAGANFVKFAINNKFYTVGSDSTVPPTTSLLTFIREHAHLKGTKASCYHGSCGACTVVATKKDLETGGLKTFSVRACTTLVYACDGWAIATIEYLGDRYRGYHSLQKVLTGFYGTQCGFCSPGVVMSMYGELKSTGNLTAESVEKNLDGNLCRCTGYRPILDAFKSLTTDATEDQKAKIRDIEDSFKSLSKCAKSGKPCSGSCGNSNCEDIKKSEKPHLEFPDELGVPREIKYESRDVKWYKPSTIQGILQVLKMAGLKDQVKFIVGNTGAAVYPGDTCNVYVDTTGVDKLYKVAMETPLVLGANVSLTRCISIFKEMAEKYPRYGHLEQLANHWSQIGNVGIRNLSSWAGNLMLKGLHKDFQSDVFMTLAAVGATMKMVNDASTFTCEIKVEDFLNAHTKGMFIVSLSIPPLEENTHVMTYKISPTTVNSLGYLIAAFRLTLKDFKVSDKPAILFSGVDSNFTNARATENFLVGKDLRDNETLQGAVKHLKTEVKPTSSLGHSTTYIQTLAGALLYKAIATILGEEADASVRSAASLLKRDLCTSEQAFDENKETWPVGQPITKLDSNVQIAGEAEYMDDIEALHNEVHGAFVQTSVASGKIKTVDPSDALKVPGVIDFISHVDLEGPNSFYGSFPDPLFVSGTIKYCGQSVGLIVANTRDIALQAVKLVKVEYEDVGQEPVLTIGEALKHQKVNGPSEDVSLDAPHKVSGVYRQGTQHPLYLEPLAARVVPIEDGYDVCATAQGPTAIQKAVANILCIPFNSVDVTIRRIGGGFGGKQSRGMIVVCAAAVAARKLKRPVRVVLDISGCMTLVGWREPYYSKYEAGFDGEGKISYVDVDFIGDVGHAKNESSAAYGLSVLPSVYYAQTWSLRSSTVTTDTAANTYVRSPGRTEAVATMENIIEHIALTLNMDPVKLRERNLFDPSVQKSKYGPKEENVVKTRIFSMLKEKASYDERRKEVDQFNRSSRWKKRGLSLVPMFYPYTRVFGYLMKFNVQVVIYAGDGSVVISHGAVEMGQGLNTKAAQVASKTLGCPLNLVSVKSTNTVTGANSDTTGGSFGSDAVPHGTRLSCEKILQRISKVKHTLPEDCSWPALVAAAADHGVDLCERYWTNEGDYPREYDIFGGSCLEVEVDVLTGQYVIRRADIIEDAGRSLSPYVDIGQIEGSFIMGIGRYTSEEVKYDPKTGRKLTDTLLTYHAPSAMDIPTDFRVTMLPNADNKYGVFSSKATGEPALLMSCVVDHALRDAIKSARADAGVTGWFDMDAPVTVEKIQQLCLVDSSHFMIRKA